MTAFAHFFAAAHADLAVWGIASCCCSVLLLLTCWWLPDVRRTPGWQFLYSSLYEIYCSAGFVAVALIHSPPINLPSPFMLPVPLHIPLAASFPASPREHQPAELASVNSTWAVTEDDYEIVEHLICSAYLPLLVTVLAADMGANCWRLLMYVDLIVVYHNPFLPNTARPLYHVAVLLAAVFWGLAISDTDVLCTTADASGSLNLQTLTWGLVYAPFFLFVVCGGGLYAAVAWLLSRDEQHRPISLLARQRVMQHCLLYLLLYGLLFGALAAAYANFRLFEQIGQSFFVHAVAALTAGRPAFAFLGWLLINRVPQRVACSACRGSDGPQPNFLPMLKQPLMAEAHLPGAGWLHRLSKTRGMHGGAGRASSGARAVEGSETAADSVLISTNSHDSTASEMRGAGEVGFKEELRYELVLDVTRAIAELAEREAVPQPPPPERAAGGDVSTCAASSATGSVAASVAGAGFAAAAAGPATPKDERACNEWDVLHSPRRSLASMAGLTPQQPQPQVQHYAVAHFRAIRAAFGINPREFASAFANSLPELQQSSRLLRESVSEGASGSFFYWVKHPDGRDTGYIVKQVTHREKDVLMSILPAYKEHVQRRNGASLLQYLSCHSMRLRWQWAGKVYFVVMRNFFPIRPQLCFDLKGATANRRALKAWQLHQSNTVAGMYDTLRDWEWMDIGMTTDMDSSDRAVLWETLSADTELLVRQNILDYSLLIGIYRPPATLIPQQKREQMRELVRQCCGTAYVSRDRQKVYFFGLIDVLEKFSLRWRVQRMVLRLLYALAMRWSDSDGISAMPPPLYADRFQTFVAHEVLHMEASPHLAPVDDLGRAGGLWTRFKQLIGVYGKSGGGRRPRGSGLARWRRLWERRRRGLVKQRIDSEHDDYIARIRELEEHIQILEHEVTALGGASRRDAGSDNDVQ